ncbi:MAG: type I 3-dehydroquinate dehydratase [Elusimicrobia bacterium]|nr:type I 3-dehydroquinate dehydratase [Candidatus Obscuribacterium magneticum]
MKRFLARQASLLEKRPLVVGTLTAEVDLSAQIHRALKAPVDLIEVRLDTFPGIYKPLPDSALYAANLLSQIRRHAKKPLLLTIRSHEERGEVAPKSMRMGNAARASLFMRLWPLCDLVDVEIQSAPWVRSLTRIAHAWNVDVIHSVHDFSGAGRLSKFESLCRDSLRWEGDAFKVAVTPKTNNQLEKFLSWGLDLKHRKKILIGMGRPGLPSRFIGFSFGSILTYGHLGKAAAPGQVPVRELAQSIKEIYLDGGS